ncbi:MAG: SpoIID/LytB domain-containing protein [Candidatus Curtissbacteria bacterium]
MRKILALFLVILISSLFLFIQNTNADELSDLQKQIDDLQNQLDSSKKATTPLESEVKSLESQLASINSRIFQIQKDLAKSEEDLATQRKILAATVRSFYMGSFVDIPLLTFFSSGDATEALRNVALQQESSREDKNIISDIGGKIAKLADDKKRLAAAQKQVNQQSQFFKGEIAKAKSFQSELSGQIAALSSRQQEILAARSGSFTVSGDSELADDYLASIAGFKESAPGGYFAVFSFGAYSHRNGMSQYGALGRAKSGQNAEQILAAYYPSTTIRSDYPVMSQITVDGKTGSFEDWYLHRIYEVPESWPKEVLKAQAIAARTYAIKYTNNGQGSICSNENCQVFKDSPKTGAWKAAVEETRGKVLVDGGGNPVSTQYASTHGGWTKTAGWDTTDGSGGSNLLSKAYDAVGGSPWLYKAWWREGYSSGGSTCGRSNPWLSPQEMADVVNAAIALKTSGIDTSRITPVTTSCWGGNPYSMEELKNLVAGNGGISNATSKDVSLGDGRTNSVTINGVSISGDDFCKAFNLRAPGNVRIPQWSGSSCGGAFFNIERK